MNSLFACSNSEHIAAYECGKNHFSTVPHPAGERVGSRVRKMEMIFPAFLCQYLVGISLMAAEKKTEQLIPPPELSPPPQNVTSPTERLVAWCDLMNTCEHFLLAGLRRKIGPDGDIRLAYRNWYRRQCEEKDRERLAERRSSRRDGESHAF